MDTNEESLRLHQKLRGKIETGVKMFAKTPEDLALLYTPGVAAVSSSIAADATQVRNLTGAGNTVAVVTDGSAVLGLGNIGPLAALPVMEGKCMLFKQLAGLDAVPIILDVHEPSAIVEAILAIAPSFAAINLEDIAAPNCFAVERMLKSVLSIPVMHDDQHGTAVVVAAGLMNAAQVVQKEFRTLSVTLVGAGAAGIAVAELLLELGVTNITLVDTRGVVGLPQTNLTKDKRKVVERTTSAITSGTLEDALKGADVLIGVSRATIDPALVRTMASQPIVFALANPTPEIMPESAIVNGAAVVATGRSDFPNQLNNVLAFPGIFRGAIDSRATSITTSMRVRAARALAQLVDAPSPTNIIPTVFDARVVPAVAAAVGQAEVQLLYANR